ncbi:acyl carrier protein [Nonomuraea sp. MG754425]|nr:acyl carrier protein [Nonomuraea sp. MG754425]
MTHTWLNDTEREIVALWATLLNLDPMSVLSDSDFFLLGGDSHAFVMLMAAISDAFSVELMVDDLYESGFTVRGMAELVVANTE